MLAGGASRRMGHDKATLRLGGRRLVDHLADRLAGAVDGVVVAAGGRPLGRADEVDDAAGVTGPLAGLLAGLRATSAEVVVAAPVDAPLGPPAVLLRLAALCAASGRAAAVAVVDGHVQPLHVAIRRAAVPAVEARVTAGEVSPRRLLGWLDALRVDPDGWADLDGAATFARDWDRPGDLPPEVDLPTG